MHPQIWLFIELAVLELMLWKKYFQAPLLFLAIITLNKPHNIFQGNQRFPSNWFVFPSIRILWVPLGNAFLFVVDECWLPLGALHPVQPA